MNHSSSSPVLQIKQEPEEKKALRAHLKDKRSVMDEYKLIKSKKSELPRNLKSFVVGMIEEEE